jgi:magnesium chelatase family protein
MPLSRRRGRGASRPEKPGLQISAGRIISEPCAADTKKGGTLYDLRFFTASLRLRSKYRRCRRTALFRRAVIAGELRGVAGALPMALAAERRGLEQSTCLRKMPPSGLCRERWRIWDKPHKLSLYSLQGERELSPKAAPEFRLEYNGGADFKDVKVRSKSSALLRSRFAGA